MTDSTPQPELRRLEPLVGRWRSEGETVSSGPPSIRIRGTDEYEWLAGGYFLLHRVDVLLGDDRVNVLELIGPYDPASQTYPMRSFDSQGNFTTMHASFNVDGSWLFAGDTERARLVLGEDGRTMAAHWEQLRDGVWQAWMDMRFARQ
jgi:hypothetical protein